MRNDEKIKVLQSYTVNYPLLEFIGKTLRMPIAIITENRTTGLSVVNQLSFNPIVIDSSWSTKDVEETITSTVSEAIVWIRPELKRRTLRSQEIEELVLNSSCMNMLGRKDAAVSVFILVNRFVDKELKGKVFEVNIDSCGSEFRINETEVVPEETTVPIILHEIMQLDKKSCLHPLKAAAFFLNPDKREQYLEAADEMIDNAIINSDKDCIAPIVIDELINFMKEKNLVVHTMDSLRNTEINDFQNAVILEGKKMFITEKMFKIAVALLTETMGIDMIKGRLEEENILIPSLNGYTRKKLVRTKKFNGRIHVLAFDVSNYPEITGLKY